MWQPHNNKEATDFIYKTAKNYPKKVTLISIGILTNIGLVCKNYPDFENYIAHMHIL